MIKVIIENNKNLPDSGEFAMARFIRNISFFAALAIAALVADSAFAGGKSSSDHHSSKHSSKHHKNHHSYHGKSGYPKSFCAPIYTVENHPCEPLVDVATAYIPENSICDDTPVYTEPGQAYPTPSHHKNHHVKKVHYKKGSNDKHSKSSNHKSSHHKDSKKHK